MTLLNDAKKCYVGTTPITTVMAGSVQVWPKGEPPVGPFDKLTMYENTETNQTGDTGLFLSWETLNRPSTCARASAYTIQSFNNDPNNNGWELFSYFGDRASWAWLPTGQPFVMALWIGPANTENDIFRVRFESSPGVFQYSAEREDAANISHLRLPAEYQENECYGRPNP